VIKKNSEVKYENKYEGYKIGIIAASPYLDLRDVDYYAKNSNLNATESIVSYWEYPAGVQIFFESDYLVSTPDIHDNGDSVYKRFRYILDHLPMTYMACLSRVNTIDSKFGRITIDNLDKNCLSAQAEYDLIEVGRSYDKNSPSEIFWELDAKNAKLMWEGNAVSFSEYQQDYYELLTKIEQEKEQLPPNYYLILNAKLDEFHKNTYLVLERGSNLLLNSGFEEQKNKRIADWVNINLNRIRIINSSSRSHSGNTAVRITGQDTALTQQVEINPKEVYLVQQYTKSSVPAQTARLQVLWLDGNSQFIKADIVPYTATAAWLGQKAILFPPSNSKYAVVYVTVLGESSVLFDDVSLQAVAYNGSQ
jgi:hypothetical protein